MGFVRHQELAEEISEVSLLVMWAEAYRVCACLMYIFPILFHIWSTFYRVSFMCSAAPVDNLAPSFANPSSLAG